MHTATQPRLWLIRHGETEWSAAGKHTSRTDVLLTDKGGEQAKELRPYFEHAEFCAVFTSPMTRARETCRLAGFGERAVVDPDLQEWDYGVYEGRTTREIQQQIPGWSVWTNPIEGGESLDEVGARADHVIAKALAAADRNPTSPVGGTGQQPSGKACDVALFAHAHILRIVAARWIGREPGLGSVLSLSTGSISILGWERETRVIERWNLTAADQRA